CFRTESIRRTRFSWSTGWSRKPSWSRCRRSPRSDHVAAGPPLGVRPDHLHWRTREAAMGCEWLLVSHLHFFVLLSSASEFGKALGAAAGPFAAVPSTSNDTVA